ncbi:hypothetical protein FDB15_09755 [Clostridium botulinum]|uniref:hypothetical protein n=1 Tax=unclassified Clostridium TaxID=2614128 RepID=UPI0013C6E9D9|nr:MULTISPECIES: hypothetical protein [unclassified Clostridium]NFG31404.1 hypothetical protein [Clostridium botulinum]NFI02586.1 hypothetical protein [Clostridium botulinum]NFI65007.1 hypothetical protein [Clostridium botulinum]NFJ45499.1 hypothetical protein [Clostridium botulinum]NFJ49127.1 hypothetical protein [Clostridium botulinum]
MKKKQKFNTAPYIIIGSITLIIICILVIVPIWLQVKEKTNYITYDTWIQFFGSIGGAMFGGSITAIGLHLSLKENRKVLKLQQINEDIQNLFEYYGILCDLFCDTQVLYQSVDNDNIIGLNKDIVSDLFLQYAKNINRYTKINSNIANPDYLIKLSEAHNLYHESIKLLKATNYRQLELANLSDMLREKTLKSNNLYNEIINSVDTEIKDLKNIKHNIISR